MKVLCALGRRIWKIYEHGTKRVYQLFFPLQKQKPKPALRGGKSGCAEAVSPAGHAAPLCLSPWCAQETLAQDKSTETLRGSERHLGQSCLPGGGRQFLTDAQPAGLFVASQQRG